MPTEVKNPFGLRDGRLVLISDLGEGERGLACKCVCPNCKEPFEARLGRIRVHHFAHSGAGCDETAAYLAGLYGFIKEYLETHAILLPEVRVYYSVNAWNNTIITKENCREEIRLSPEGVSWPRCRVANQAVSVRFDRVEIIKEKNERPEALLACYREKRMAFVVTPPETVCRKMQAKPYEDIATLEVLLSDKADLISRVTSKEMESFFSDPENYQWISTPSVEKLIPEINAERERANKEFRERIEQETKRRAERERALEREREREERERETTDAVKMEVCRQQYERTYDLNSDRRSRGPYGRRIKCKECGWEGPESEFGSYQGNTGTCRKCCRKRKSYVEGSQTEEPKRTIAERAEENPNICPYCGGRLVRRIGYKGPFWGCSNYPKCEYRRSIE